MRTTSLTAALGLATALAVTPGLAAPASADAPTCVDGKTATIVVQPTTTWPKPWVVGTPGDDVIVGTDGRDRIDGGAGNDTICSLGSDDHVVGGAGDDRLFGGLDEYYPDKTTGRRHRARPGRRLRGPGLPGRLEGHRLRRQRLRRPGELCQRRRDRSPSTSPR